MDIPTKIKGLIQHEMEDTTLNHFKSLYYQYQWCGNIKGDTFTIWKNGFWNGLLYPVIKGEIANNKVKVSYTQNPIGRIAFIIWAYGCPLLIILEPLKQLLQGNYKTLPIVLLVPVVFHFLLSFANKRIMKASIDELEEYLQIKP